MKIKFSILALFCAFMGFAQQFVNVDFGSPSLQTTTPGWNNLTLPNTPRYLTPGPEIVLLDTSGADTGAKINVSDTFDTYNDAGTSAPNSLLDIPATASRDSFFGAGGPTAFNGYTKESGQLTLTNLDPAKYYSFSFFASRAGASDNREAEYSLGGSTTQKLYLNASNNTANTVEYYNMQPTAEGKITITVKKGPNNNNSNGFYYLGTMKMVISATPYTNNAEPELSLLYPNGGHKWEVGKTVNIKWSSANVDTVNFELSTNNGASWTSVGSAPGNAFQYGITVPNTISDQCLVKITGSGISKQSASTFSIIQNEGAAWNIVVLGSSTAEGVGPGDPNNAWVARYKKYLEELDTRYSVTNLGKGGYTTYQILPTGTVNPSGTPAVDPERNITKALTYNPKAIIINMPSNDAASGFTVATQIANYDKVIAGSNNVALFVATPQPRNFGSNTGLLQIQLDMIEATNTKFGERAIDFWTGFGVEGGNGILPQYNVDGIHMNDAAHLILFERVIGKGIHTFVTTLATQNVSSKNGSIRVFPNPIVDNYTVSVQKESKTVNIQIIDLAGKIVDQYQGVKTNNGVVKLSKKALKSGVYLLKVESSAGASVGKIIVK